MLSPVRSALYCIPMGVLPYSASAPLFSHILHDLVSPIEGREHQLEEPSP
jgi:hypothetical protein